MMSLNIYSGGKSTPVFFACIVESYRYSIHFQLTITKQDGSMYILPECIAGMIKQKRLQKKVPSKKPKEINH